MLFSQIFSVSSCAGSLFFRVVFTALRCVFMLTSTPVIVPWTCVPFFNSVVTVSKLSFIKHGMNFILAAPSAIRPSSAQNLTSKCWLPGSMMGWKHSLYVHFGEESILTFCSFLIGFFFFFLLWACKTCFYILEINSLLVALFKNTFPPICGLTFHCVMVFFVGQKLLSLTRSHVFILSLFTLL